MLTEKMMYQGITGSVSKLFPGILKRGFEFPKLYFSDEEPRYKKYGSLNDNEIREGLAEIGRKYAESHRTEGDIIGFLTHPEFIFMLRDILSGRRTGDPVFDPERNPWVKGMLNDAKDLLAKRAVLLVVDGKYDAKNNEITIYEKAYGDKEDREELLRRTVAHEMFHAIHRFCAPGTYFDNSYHAEVVREALADFYSFMLCLDETATSADHVNKDFSRHAAYDRAHFWSENLFSDIPYPNAIFCMYKNGTLDYISTYADCLKTGSKDRLINIMKISIGDMEEAYRELVPEPFRKKPERKRFVHKARVWDGPDCERTFGKTIGALAPFDEMTWEILKRIIKENGIESLEELVAFFPKGIISITRGRFITLDSGEILSAYPQWEITDWERFRRFADKSGYLAGNTKTIVEVSYGKQKCSYILDTSDGEGIAIGDEVNCYNANGKVFTRTVTGVCHMTEREYREYCKQIGYEELSKAKKCNIEDSFGWKLEKAIDRSISNEADLGSAQQLIVMNATDASKLGDKELRKKLIPGAGKINRRETMVPVYIYKILKEKPEKKFKTNEVCRLLEDFPYELELESKAVRRTLLSLAFYEEDIFGMEVGRELYFWYSEDGPEEGYITSDDYDDPYDDFEDWE